MWNRSHWLHVLYRRLTRFQQPVRVQDVKHWKHIQTGLKQLEDIANQFKGVDKSFAIQAGREIRVMVVPEQISDDDMVLLAREISKQIEFELEYPGQIKVNVIRESRVTDYAKIDIRVDNVNVRIPDLLKSRSGILLS